MRTALALRGFALFAAGLFAVVTSLGIVVGQRWADRAAPAREPPLAVAPLEVSSGADRPALAPEPITAHPDAN